MKIQGNISGNGYNYPDKEVKILQSDTTRPIFNVEPPKTYQEIPFHITISEDSEKLLDAEDPFSIKIPENHHAAVPFLAVNKEGNVPVEEFTVEKLKEKFNPIAYDIVETKDKTSLHDEKTISIIDKSTGKKVIDIYSNYGWGSHDYNVRTYYDNGNVRYEYIFGEDPSKRGNNADSWHSFTKTYSEDGLHCSQSSEFNYNDEQYKLVTEYSRSDTTTEFDFTKKIDKYYNKNGELVFETDSLLSPDAVDDVLACDKLTDGIIGISNLMTSFEDYEKSSEFQKIMSELNADNVLFLLALYKNKTGEDLLDKLSPENTKRILELASKCPYWIGNNDIINDYIADRLVEDIANGNGKIIEDIKMLSKETCPSVLSHYIKNNKKSGDATENNFIANMFDITNMFNKLLNPQQTNGLFKAITNSSKICDADKNVLIRHILSNLDNISDRKAVQDIVSSLGVDYLLSFYPDKYTDDIKENMSAHINDIEKLYDDFLILLYRGENDKDAKIIKPNGKIDEEFNQGNTGNCWLLSGIKMLLSKPETKKELESLIKIDENTGDVTVTLKGVNKQYTIKAKEIEQANHLSAKDGDVRAIELAVDKYRNDWVQGGRPEEALNILLGYGKKSESKFAWEFDKFDFNDPNKFYSLSLPFFNYFEKFDDIQNDKKVFLKDNGEYTGIEFSHAYTIIKSDKNYVYVVNPWNSSEILRITHEKLKELDPRITIISK